MTNPTPTFAELIDRVRDGSDGGWAFFDQHIGPLLEERGHFEWAKIGVAGNPNEQVRDACATVLARADFPLYKSDFDDLRKVMHNDSHEPVCWWLANALYKRGDRDQQVVQIWEEACQQQNPAGEFARKLKAA